MLSYTRDGTVPTHLHHNHERLPGVALHLSAFSYTYCAPTKLHLLYTCSATSATAESPITCIIIMGGVLGWLSTHPPSFSFANCTCSVALGVHMLSYTCNEAVSAHLDHGRLPGVAQHPPTRFQLRKLYLLSYIQCIHVSYTCNRTVSTHLHHDHRRRPGLAQHPPTGFQLSKLYFLGYIWCTHAQLHLQSHSLHSPAS